MLTLIKFQPANYSVVYIQLTSAYPFIPLSSEKMLFLTFFKTLLKSSKQFKVRQPSENGPLSSEKIPNNRFQFYSLLFIFPAYLLCVLCMSLCIWKYTLYPKLEACNWVRTQHKTSSDKVEWSILLRQLHC